MGCKLSSQPKKHTLKFFSGEGIRHLGLEELKYDEKTGGMLRRSLIYV